MFNWLLFRRLHVTVEDRQTGALEAKMRETARERERGKKAICNGKTVINNFVIGFSFCFFLCRLGWTEWMGFAEWVVSVMCEILSRKSWDEWYSKWCCVYRICTIKFRLKQIALFFSSFFSLSARRCVAYFCLVQRYCVIVLCKINRHSVGGIHRRTINTKYIVRRSTRKQLIVFRLNRNEWKQKRTKRNKTKTENPKIQLKLNNCNTEWTSEPSNRVTDSIGITCDIGHE